MRKLAMADSRVHKFLLLCVFVVISSTVSASEEEKEYVLTLDHSNFSEIVSKHNFIVVEFYAPWCGHCKHLAPEYEKAASMLSTNEPAIFLAKVDADAEANKELAGKYEVQGFPTIKILRNGGEKIQEYNGPREADGILTYLKKQVGPASPEIKTKEDEANLIDDKKIFIVGIFPKFSGEEYDNFMILADKLRSDYDFGHTRNAKLISRGDSSVTNPTLRLLKPFDELFVDSKNFEVNAMEKFIDEASTPLVTRFDQSEDNQPFVSKYFNSPDSKAMFFFDYDNEKEELFKSTYHEAAGLYKGKGLVFLMGNVQDSAHVLVYFGLEKDQTPALVLQDTKGVKYVSKNVQADQIAPYFKDFMYQQVLLEIYAPWCGHCKKLAPILDEVALSFEQDPDVVIAKLDGTKNDIPSDTFDVKGFPTLYLRSSGGKLVQYDGNRTKEDLTEFIQKNRDATPESTSETVKDEL